MVPISLRPKFLSFPRNLASISSSTDAASDPSQVKFKFCSTESGTRYSVINTLKAGGIPCNPGQMNPVVYFIISIVALVTLLWVLCLWLQLYSFSSVDTIPEPMNFGRTINHSVPAPATNYQSGMEEGRLNANQPPPRKASGLGVIMPGEAEVTFIAEPSSPIRTTAKDKTKFDSSMEEEEDSNPVQHPSQKFLGV
ncbi:hypothetical protein R1flu_016350 [Riccia fluitans]|uniref:Uncharacterized protein n=1 Tax=Riccia fluitans TaxID=41844 RepID=A0ABD1YMM6_9MARC